MSNAYLLETTGNLPPQVPLSFHLDDGNSAVASANVIQVDGLPGSGITTQLGASNQIYITFADTVQTAIVTTVGTVPQNLFSINLSPVGTVPGVFTFAVKIVAYCTAGPDIGKVGALQRQAHISQMEQHAHL